VEIDGDIDSETGDIADIPDSDNQVVDFQDADDEIIYNGDCKIAKPGETLNLNIVQHKLTVSSVDIKNTEWLRGELFGENIRTASMFKISDVNSELAGKSFNIAEGKYNFYFKDTSGFMIKIDENVEISSSLEISLTIPLFEISGAVNKNGAPFPETLTDEEKAVTKVLLKISSYSYEIPFSLFGSFSLVIPKGKYQLVFSGHLSSGKSTYYYKLPESLNMDSDSSQNIDLTTVNYSGSITNEGISVDKGFIAISDGSVNHILTDLSQSASYSAEVVTDKLNTQYSILYLAESYKPGSLPFSAQAVDQWQEITENKSVDIALNFGLIEGTLTLNDSDFPGLTIDCNSSENILCSRGFLRAKSGGGESITIKNLGKSEGDTTFSAYLSRREISGEENPKKYRFFFDGNFLDDTIILEKTGFSIQISDSEYSFKNGDEYVTTLQTGNLNIKTRKVSGSINIKPSGDEHLYLKYYRDGSSNVSVFVPVFNLKSNDGSYSFQAPAGEYDLYYEGKSILNLDKNIQLLLLTNLDIADSDIVDENVNIISNELKIDLAVNGLKLADYLGSIPSLQKSDLLINNSSSNEFYSLTLQKDSENNSFVDIVNGTWDLYLSLHTKDSSGMVNSFRIPLQKEIQPAGTFEQQIELSMFDLNINVNGEKMQSYSDYRAIFELDGSNIYFDKDGNTASKIIAIPGEYDSPAPSIVLNEGFDLKQKIISDCIYVGK